MNRLFYCLAILLMTTITSQAQNAPVSSLDLLRFSGKWYSLSSIPTFLDKNWRQTIENYSLRPDHTYQVFTTYTTLKGRNKSIRSKLFPGKASEIAEMKAQFWWPFKVGYRVIELAGDYSYTVIGHPKKKYLFIMSRRPTMNPVLYRAIVARCAQKGYATDQLVWQDHKPVSGVSTP